MVRKQKITPVQRSISNFNVLTMAIPGNIAGVMIYARVGFVNESERETGLSHLLEHTLFESWNKYPSPEIFTQLSRIGAEYNAMTSEESTIFYAYADKKYLWKGLKDQEGNAAGGIGNFMLESVINPVFTDETLERERHAVEQELLMYKSDPMKNMQEALYEYLYPDTGLAYNADIDKSLEVLPTLTKEVVSNYHMRNYTTESVLIVLFNPNPVSASTLKKQFSGLIPNFNQQISLNYDRIRAHYNSIPFTIDSRLEVPIKKVVGEGIEKPFILVTFQNSLTPHNKDRYILSLVLLALTDGLGSILYKKLRQELAIIYNISSSQDTNKWGGLAMFEFSTKTDENVRTCISEVYKAVIQFYSLENPAFIEAVDAAKNKVKMQYDNRCLSAPEKCEIISTQVFAEIEEILSLSDMVNIVLSATYEKIAAVAYECLNPNNSVIIELNSK